MSLTHPEPDLEPEPVPTQDSDAEIIDLDFCDQMFGAARSCADYRSGKTSPSTDMESSHCSPKQSMYECGKLPRKRTLSSFEDQAPDERRTERETPAPAIDSLPVPLCWTGHWTGHSIPTNHLLRVSPLHAEARNAFRRSLALTLIEELCGCNPTHVGNIVENHCHDRILLLSPTIRDPLFGKQELMLKFSLIMEVFPDAVIQITSVVVHDDSVSVTFVFNGTQVCPMPIEAILRQLKLQLSMVQGGQGTRLSFAQAMVMAHEVMSSLWVLGAVADADGVRRQDELRPREMSVFMRRTHIHFDEFNQITRIASTNLTPTQGHSMPTNRRSSFAWAK